MKQTDPSHPDHYCKPPRSSSPGAHWSCKCGKRFRYEAPKNAGRLGQRLRGHWLQVSG